VGVVGVEVIDGQPFELAIEIALDPSHEAPDVRSEIELRGVFRGQDEPKLVALPGTRLLKGLDASRPVGRVRHALGAVLLNTGALVVITCAPAFTAAAATCRSFGLFGIASIRCSYPVTSASGNSRSMIARSRFARSWGIVPVLTRFRVISSRIRDVHRIW